VIVCFGNRADKLSFKYARRLVEITAHNRETMIERLTTTPKRVGHVGEIKFRMLPQVLRQIRRSILQRALCFSR
jgi:hypothetical protein